MMARLAMPPANQPLPAERRRAQDPRNGNGAIERDEAPGKDLRDQVTLYDAIGNGALSGAEVDTWSARVWSVPALGSDVPRRM